MEPVSVDRMRTVVQKAGLFINSIADAQLMNPNPDVFTIVNASDPSFEIHVYRAVRTSELICLSRFEGAENELW